MYLTGITAEQISAPSYDTTCQARVRWGYGDQTSDFIEFWWQGGSNSNWDLVLQFPVDENNPAEETVLVLPAGTPGVLRACPRTTDDAGNPEFRQPDENDEEQVWTGFCVGTAFTGQRREDEPPDRCRTAPEITAMELGFGSVTVRWTNPEGYDRFVMYFAGPNSGGNPEPYYTDEQHYQVGRVPAGGCWARVAGIHDGNDWTGTSTCQSPDSAIRETSLPPELGYITPQFTPGTPIGTVKQNSQHRELFLCLPDGRPVGVWGDPYWHPFYGHGNGPGFPAGAPLTALSRDDGYMDLFGAAQDRRIHLGWWNGNPWREWFVLSDPDFPPGAWIAALSRNTDQMDIFAIDLNGTMRSNWWNGPPWRGWFELPGERFRPGSPIAAIRRNPDQMDIFAVGGDGIVRSNWWNGNPWRGWFALPGADFPPGASIAATNRNPDQMDIFAIGNDGVVRSNWWNGNPWRGWFAMPGVAFPPGGSIAAHSRGPHWMEIAAVANDGQAYINRWRGNWSGWQVLAGQKFPPGAHVAIHGELFCVANDGYVRMNTLGLYSPSWYKVE